MCKSEQKTKGRNEQKDILFFYWKNVVWIENIMRIKRTPDGQMYIYFNKMCICSWWCTAMYTFYVWYAVRCVRLYNGGTEVWNVRKINRKWSYVEWMKKKFVSLKLESGKNEEKVTKMFFLFISISNWKGVHFVYFSHLYYCCQK